MGEDASAVLAKIRARGAVQSAARHATAIRRGGAAMSSDERAEHMGAASRDLARAVDNVKAARAAADMVKLDTNRRVFEDDLDSLDARIERLRAKLEEYDRRAGGADAAAAAASTTAAPPVD